MGESSRYQRLGAQAPQQDSPIAGLAGFHAAQCVATHGLGLGLGGAAEPSAHMKVSIAIVSGLVTSTGGEYNRTHSDVYVVHKTSIDSDGNRLQDTPDWGIGEGARGEPRTQRMH